MPQQNDEDVDMWDVDNEDVDAEKRKYVESKFPNVSPISSSNSILRVWTDNRGGNDPCSATCEPREDED